MRSFTDDDGRPWEVRDVRAAGVTDSRRTFVRPEFEAGWLLFTSGEERRRLAPLPADWPHATDTQLRSWCRAAMPTAPGRR